MDRPGGLYVNVRAVPSSSRPARWLAAVLALALPACSIIGMKRVPADLDSGEVIDCTSSWTLPLIDMGSAVTTGSAAVLLHSQASSQDNSQEGGGSATRIVAWSAVGLAVVFIASSAYGAVQRARCQNALDGIGTDRVPQWKEESTPPPGTLGASCKGDDDCGEELVCGEPMYTCIAPPAPEPQAPPEAAPAGGSAPQDPAPESDPEHPPGLP
jgi:hypothetical protein